MAPPLGEVGLPVPGFGTRVVVLHLVVVPSTNPGVLRMSGLQIGVGLILGVPVAVIGQGVTPPGGVRYRTVPPWHISAGERPLVDVVTEVDDEVQALLGH